MSRKSGWWLVALAPLALLPAFVLRPGAAPGVGGVRGGVAQAAAAPQARDSAVINELLEEVRMEAAQLDVDAEALLFMDRSPLFRQAHMQQLNTIRTHINEIGKLEQRMQEERASGSAWQQRALDQVRPLLQQMADNLTQAIEHYNRTRHASHIGPYADYLQANADLASRLRAMVNDAVQYAKAKSEFDARSAKMASGQ
jgi:hypothetical protein